MSVFVDFRVFYFFILRSLDHRRRCKQQKYKGTLSVVVNNNKSHFYIFTLLFNSFSRRKFIA